jgi:hypothetical protein
MKLTRNGFRLKCALGLVLMGLIFLPMVDWAYLRAEFTTPLTTWRHTGFLERRQKAFFPAAAAALIIAGFTLCLEFAGDPPPRPDPWETDPPPVE